MPVAHELAPVSSPDSVGASCLPLANRTRAGRRDCGGGAPFCSALRAAQCAMRSRKRPCQPKTAKRFLGGHGSQSPSGQAKERMRVLPVRRGFSAPGAPAFFLQALRVRGEFFGTVCPACLLCAEGTGFLLLFHVKPKEGSSLFLRCSAALFPTCAPLFCRLYADFCACLSGLRCRCPPCALCAQFRLVLAVCLPVPCWLHAHFSLIFCLFLFGFCLSNFFSFVAQAATGLYFLPKRK